MLLPACIYHVMQCWVMERNVWNVWFGMWVFNPRIKDDWTLVMTADGLPRSTLQHPRCKLIVWAWSSFCRHTPSCSTQPGQGSFLQELLCWNPAHSLHRGCASLVRTSPWLLFLLRVVLVYQDIVFLKCKGQNDSHATPLRYWLFIIKWLSPLARFGH